jgi:hypothetical protein
MKNLFASLVTLSCLAYVFPLHAQISISNLDTAEVIDFTGLNGFSTFGGSVLTSGEYAATSVNGSTWNPITSSTSSTTEYGFGATGAAPAGSLVRGPKDENGGGTAGLGEWEIGSTASDGVAIEIGPGIFTDGAFFLRFQNDTGGTVSQWKINYDGHYSNLTDLTVNADFIYSADDWSSTSSVGALSFTSPGALTPSPTWVDAGITEQTISASVADGDDLVIGWLVSGSALAAGDVIAFDNISVTAIPEPSTLALVGLALGSLVFFRRWKS